MNKTLFTLPCCATLCVAVSAAPTREFIHVAVPAEGKPVLDGRLEEPCWQRAPVFWLRTPPTSRVMTHNVAETATAVSMAYDEAGLYLGIVCSQKNLAALKATVTARDGGAVWQDDSVELFISPLISKINYYKFDVNSLGVFSDIYRHDAALTYPRWNALNVRCVSGRLIAAWTIEFFVSWKDLEASPKAGDLIGFQMTRFMWEGSTLNVNGSTGGNYGRPKMGFVYLAPAKIPGLAEIARAVDGRVPGDWYCLDGAEWVCSEKKSVTVEAPEVMEAAYAEKLKGALASLQEAPGDGYAALRSRAASLEEEKDPVARFIALRQLLFDLTKVRAEMEMGQLLE
jgi:hypothetical protein